MPNCSRYPAIIAIAASVCTVFSWLVPAQGAEPAPVPLPDASVFFETKVRPLLTEHCFSCHGEKKQQGELRLDSRQAVLKGGSRGAAVVPGKPDESLLVQAIRHEYGTEPRMPPKGKLPDQAIGILTQWVQMGVPWPTAATAKAGGQRSQAELLASARTHWAFQSIRKPPVPPVHNAAWPQTEVDRFILSALEKAGVQPAPPASRAVWLRRVYFDLIGLPPTPEEVAAFGADPSADAYAKVVDRLLASPRYGERWGRHWLDVARYGDNKGVVEVGQGQRLPYAHGYRDYVIRAFNEDTPYDQFILQQLAADQLPLGADQRPLAGLGFLTLTRRFMGDDIHDVIADRIDVVSRGLLGLTAVCARCHDHKYDPIPTADYYSLYGVFANSVEPTELPIVVAPAGEAGESYRTARTAKEREMAQFIATRHAELLARFRSQIADYLLAAREVECLADEDQVIPIANKNKLSALVLGRWLDLLRKARQEHDPIWGPWLAFAAIAEADFPTEAPELAKQIAANADPKKPFNALVAAAFASEPPMSLKEVASRYGRLFTQVDQQWQELQQRRSGLPGRPDDGQGASARNGRPTAQELQEGAASGTGGQQVPASLPDTAGEALRLLLYGPQAPGNVPAENSPLLDRPFFNQFSQRLEQLAELDATHPGAAVRAMVLRDLACCEDAAILVRGNPQVRGAKVPRQFLQILAGDARQPFRQGSGRLELAQAIASKDNPLTARVMVNRIWMHHFGQGLVRTPDNFGLTGESPSHPELLDYLAATFMENGWSVKRLHRLILLSSVYQQASAPPADRVGRAFLPVVGARRAGMPVLHSTLNFRQWDPDNRLLGHFPRRRLDFEALRDALLAVSGRLDTQMGGPSVPLFEQPFGIYQSAISAVKTDEQGSRRRTVYGYIDRVALPAVFRTFDFPDPELSAAGRDVTSVPQQALFLLNHPFVLDLAQAILARRDVAGLEDATERIDYLYRLLYGRAPTDKERLLGKRFVEAPPGQPSGEGKAMTAWERYVHVLLAANEFMFVD